MTAYRNETVTVEGDFICPECKQPLQPVASQQGAADAKPKKLLLIVIPSVVVLAVAALLVSRCGRGAKPEAAPKKAVTEATTPAPTPAPTPVFEIQTPTPEPATPTPTPTPEESRPSATPPPVEETISISAPSAPESEPAKSESNDVRAEVLRRIEAKQGLSEDEKDKMYQLVDRARGFTKVMTISFGTGKRDMSVVDVEVLKQELRNPKYDKYTNDPTTVFVVLGFADPTGSSEANLRISQERADNVMKSLKNKAGINNVIHSVAMGTTTLFDTEKMSKNRVVEVWAVQP